MFIKIRVYNFGLNDCMKIIMPKAWGMSEAEIFRMIIPEFCRGMLW